jgi:general secretion pathway protein G
MQPRPRGFTLIELLVVLAIVATLLMLVAPRMLQHEQSAREAVLRENLLSLRRVIDAFRADTGRYPESLDELVQRRYLRSAPLDPITGSADSWTVLPPPEGEEGQVYEVRSGAPGASREGSAYADW